MSDNKNKNEIRITGISDRSNDHLKSMAAYLGICVKQYVKKVLINAIENAPEHMKAYKKED